MKQIGEALPKLKKERLESCFNDMTEKEKVQFLVDDMNKSPGNLDSSIYDCKECNNKGLVFIAKECRGHFREYATECKCVKIRKSVQNMKKSGLESIINRSTFDKYNATEAWQKKAKESAMNFVKNVENLDRKCFFIGGGVGSGKTHLCTAIVRDFLRMGKAAKYMLWVDDSTKLKSMVNEAEYESAINEYRKVEVLYIDDFFKITKDRAGNELYPTAGDIRLAYEIINYRYQHSELITIISSERFIHEIEEIDSAVGSRIYEMSSGNALGIARERDRNYRLRNIEIL